MSAVETSYPPLTRSQLALFAGGSGDHNPVHIDIDAAKAAGFDDVFAQGMLPMALLARHLTETFGEDSLITLEVRFSAITHVGDELTCRSTEAEGHDGDSAHRRLRLEVLNQSGTLLLEGSALIAKGQDL
jgi:acyl dehydratase